MNRESDRKRGGGGKADREKKKMRKEYRVCLVKRWTLMGDAGD